MPPQIGPREGYPRACITCEGELAWQSEHYCARACAEQNSGLLGADAPAFKSKWKVREAKDREARAVEAEASTAAAGQAPSEEWAERDSALWQSVDDDLVRNGVLVLGTSHDELGTHTQYFMHSFDEHDLAVSFARLRTLLRPSPPACVTVVDPDEDSLLGRILARVLGVPFVKVDEVPSGTRALLFALSTDTQGTYLEVFDSIKERAPCLLYTLTLWREDLLDARAHRYPHAFSADVGFAYYPIGATDLREDFADRVAHLAAAHNVRSASSFIGGLSWNQLLAPVDVEALESLPPAQ